MSIDISFIRREHCRLSLKGFRSGLIVDAHVHIYAEDDLQYPPRENPLRPLPAAGTLDSLIALAEGNGVSGFWAVQPFTFYRFDNHFLCDVSRAHRDSTACVCLLDPDDARSMQLLERNVTEFGIRGSLAKPSTGFGSTESSPCNSLARNRGAER